MTVKKPKSFAQVLDDLDLREEVPQQAERPAVAAPMPMPQDSLSLSVQGAKAMPGRRTSSGRRVGNVAVMSPRVDSQGNRVRISGPGDSLALAQADRVAWETRLDVRRETGQ